MRLVLASLLVSIASSASAAENGWLAAYELCRIAVEEARPLGEGGTRSLSFSELAEFAVSPQVKDVAGREFIVSPEMPPPDEGRSFDPDGLRVLIWNVDHRRICRIAFDDPLKKENILSIVDEFQLVENALVASGRHVDLSLPPIRPIIQNGFALTGLNPNSSCVVSVISYDTHAGSISVSVGEQIEDACRNTRRGFS